MIIGDDDEIILIDCSNIGDYSIAKQQLIVGGLL